MIGGASSTRVTAGTIFWEELMERDHFEEFSEAGILNGSNETGRRGMM